MTRPAPRTATTVLLAAMAVWAAPAHANEDLYERIRRLEGVWLAVDARGVATTQVVSVFHVTANGHSVQEIMFPGTPQEMVNMYHRDGDDVRMTHYCSGGNQSMLRLLATPRPDVVQLEFAGITNAASFDDEHMHEAEFRWLGADRLQTTWRTFRDGRLLETSTLEMVRRPAATTRP